MPDRGVVSQYHDGGSPCGCYMLRWKDWKYVYYAGGHPPQLFNITGDPLELNDLAAEAAHQDVLDRLYHKLRKHLDPEQVNEQAFTSQRALVEQYGGTQAVASHPGFNYTPVGQ